MSPCTGGCFPKDVVFCVPVFQRSALDIRTVAPHQKRLKTESLQQGHLPSYEDPRGFVFCSCVRRGRKLLFAFLYCSNSQSNKIKAGSLISSQEWLSLLKEKKPGWGSGAQHASIGREPLCPSSVLPCVLALAGPVGSACVGQSCSSYMPFCMTAYFLH